MEKTEVRILENSILTQAQEYYIHPGKLSILPELAKAFNFPKTVLLPLWRFADIYKIAWRSC